jgi:hypothetical protein
MQKMMLNESGSFTHRKNEKSICIQSVLYFCLCNAYELNDDSQFNIKRSLLSLLKECTEG